MTRGLKMLKKLIILIVTWSFLVDVLGQLATEPFQLTTKSFYLFIKYAFSYHESQNMVWNGQLCV